MIIGLLLSLNRDFKSDWIGPLVVGCKEIDNRPVGSREAGQKLDFVLLGPLF